MKFLRKGVKYADLSEDEKKEYEEKFFDEETGEVPPEIDAAALNRWLFNKNTVDQVLGYLMENGTKVEGATSSERQSSLPPISCMPTTSSRGSTRTILIWPGGSAARFTTKSGTSSR